MRLGQCALAPVVERLGVRGHVLLVVQRNRIEVADRERDCVILPVHRFDLCVLRRGTALADRLQELVEDGVVPIEKDRLSFEPHRLLPQGLH